MDAPPSAPQERSLSWLLHEAVARFDLRSDQAEPAAIDASIRGGVVFRGTNLWLLIFAIVVASAGLNVNSTAVIIGAMLISPLMGPIMGIGYGAGVGDFKLLRLSLWNLALASGASVVASAAYFALSPLSTAHSELLARTTPTIWDVIIALFGGLAGIVGVTRREKSNVIPGVAIATALMPPLCTAGYGLATFNLSYFVGAAYLFFINSVFIATATLAMTRVMRLPAVAYVDAATRLRTRLWIGGVVMGTALPSLWLAGRLVSAEVFDARARAFLADAFPEDGATLVATRELDASRRVLRVTIIGEPISEPEKEALTARLAGYGLDNARLVVAQNAQPELDVSGLRRELTEDLYQRTLTLLDARGARIAELEAELDELAAERATHGALELEIRAQLPDTGPILVTSGGAEETGRSLVVVLERATRLADEDLARLQSWLAVRSGAAVIKIFDVPPAPSADPEPTASAPGAAPDKKPTGKAAPQKP